MRGRDTSPEYLDYESPTGKSQSSFSPYKEEDRKHRWLRPEEFNEKIQRSWLRMRAWTLRDWQQKKYKLSCSERSCYGDSVGDLQRRRSLKQIRFRMRLRTGEEEPTEDIKMEMAGDTTDVVSIFPPQSID